jgi:hypothetical protein
MSRRSKIVDTVFILIGVFFLISKIFNLPPFFSKFEVCPPDECKIYEIGEAGQPIGTVIKGEPGRTRTDFTSAPAGLPKGIPVDYKPMKVVASYMETLDGNKSSGEGSHTQITYSYVTKQNLTTTPDNFEKYLNKNNYAVQVSKENPSLLTAFYGHRVSGPFDQSIIVSIVPQNQFEQLETVSLIISEINKN